MGELLKDFKFKGKLGDFIAYPNMKTGRITIQEKGGSNAEKIERSPNYAVFRLHRQEFKGMSKLAKAVRHAMGTIQNMADYRMAGPLTGHMTYLKELDTVNKLGERTAMLSQKRNWLEGWQISMEHIFEKVVLNPLQVELDRTDLSCTIELPALVPGANFHPPGAATLYRWVAALGLVHDYHFDGRDNYITAPGFEAIVPALYTGAWQQSSARAAGFTVNLQLPLHYAPLPTGASLVCTIAVEGGRMKTGGMKMHEKYSSAGKVLKVQ